MLRAWLIPVVLCACTGDTLDPTDPPPTDTDVIVVTDTDTDTGEDRSATLNGTVTDPSGAPLDGVQLRLCRNIVECINNNTDASGTYSYPDVAVDWHSFEVLPPASRPDLSTAFAPVQLATQETRTLDVKLLAPTHEVTLSTTAAEHEVAAGLHLTVATTDLEPPLFAPDPDEIHGLFVRAADRVPMDEGFAVHAMWYLEPFNYKASGGLPVRIVEDPSWGLTGTDYRVRVGSYDDSAWIDAGTLTLAGGQLTGTAALPLIGPVILTDL